MKRSTRAAASVPKKPAAAPKAKKAASKAVKRSYPEVTPSIVITGGKGQEAMAFYCKAFGFKETKKVLGPNGSVMHGVLTLGAYNVFIFDEFMPSSQPKVSSIHIHVEDADKAFATAIEAGAKVTMPLENQFWGDRYGKLVDPYGHDWSIAQTVEELTDAEKKERGEKWMAEWAEKKKGADGAPAEASKTASPKAKSPRKK